MCPRCLTALAAWSCLLCFVSTTAAQGDKEIVETLRASIEQGYREAAFTATFEVHAFTADSIESALESDGDDVEKVASGFIAKDTDTLRLSVDKLADGYSYARASFDEVVNDAIGLSYRHGEEERRFVGSAYIEERDPVLAKGRVSGDIGTAVVTPLTPMGTTSASILDVWELVDGEDSPDSVEVLTGESDRLSVKLEREHTDGQKQIRTVTFRMDESDPIVERISHTVIHDDGKANEYHVVLSRFVDCGGVLLPSLIRRAHKLGVSGVHGLTWRSSDMGDRAPTDDDFVVSVPAGVSLHGLKIRPDPDAVRDIDISSISPDELGDWVGPEQQRAVGQAKEPESYAGYYIVAIVVLGVAVAGLLVARFVRNA